MVRLIITLTLGLIVVYSAPLRAQSRSFQLLLEPISINNLGGLQSFAHGQHQNEWLLVGGRLDGLHRRQPFAAFDAAGNHTQLVVVNPVTQQSWSIGIATLPQSIQEQLSSTNMEFYQHNDYLYLVGGYGIEIGTQTKKTFDKLTAIDVPGIIQAIKSNQPINSFIRQIAHQDFAVTGGHLKLIDSTFYLLGGNRFDGNYNPMGNPTYTQQYTNAIRRFQLNDDGVSIQVTWLTPFVDSVHLHRRDYNAVAQIDPNGNPSITMFSGVFQPNINLPFLYPVEVSNSGIIPRVSFLQKFNHYHCPTIPIFDSLYNEMHTFFFGGIAQFYDSLGVTVQDNNVPFVNTIAQITRNGSGQLVENKLPIEMPSLQGAGAEFIPNKQLPHYENGVIKLGSPTDTLMLGYIFGGIQSSAPNIFFTNIGAQSQASNVVYRVRYVPLLTSSTAKEITIEHPMVFPNPSDGKFRVQFNLKSKDDVSITIRNIDGKILDRSVYMQLNAATHYFDFDTIPNYNTTLLIQIQTASEVQTLKLIRSRR